MELYLEHMRSRFIRYTPYSIPYSHKESGQVLLISLLVLSIATTVALSLISRSTTDVTISNQISESSRAFSAAEAGIEEALKSGVGTSVPQVLTAGVSYNVAKADIGGAAGAYVFPKKISHGTTETLWLVNHNADGTLIETPTYTAAAIDVCWSQETTIPAMIVSVFYKTAAGGYRVAKGAYDPNSARALTNKFSAPTSLTGGCGDGTTTYKQTITFTAEMDTLLMLRLQPLYADANIAITASGALPIQGSKLESTGTSEGGLARKIVVYQQYRSPPSIFNSVIYSQGSFGH